MDTLARVFAEIWDELLNGCLWLWQGLVRAIWYKRWIGWTVMTVTGIALILTIMRSFTR